MLAGLLLAAIIAGVLYYFSFSSYFNNSFVDKGTWKEISGQEINTAQPTAVYNGMLKQIKEIEQKQIRDGENLVGRYMETIEGGQ